MTSALAHALASSTIRPSTLGRQQSTSPSGSAKDEPHRPQSPQQQRIGFASPSVGSLCARMPQYVRHPPIEAVAFAWGVSEDAQTGLGGESEVNIMAPKVVDTLLGVQFSGRGFGRVPLVAGSRNTLGIDADGQVWSWGWNERGTLGHGHRGPERKPKRVQALKGVSVVQVALGGWHSLALSDRGTVFAWGGNEYLQCGVEAGKRDILSPVLVAPLAGVRVRMVACAGMHSLALTDAGTVWTWGEPWGDFALAVERHPRQVPGAVDIAAVACGAFHNMALTRSGEVLTWGTNDYGQLGNGNTSYQTRPCRVAELDHVKVADIAAGGWHSMVLSDAGEVYIWGRGEYGRLGLGDRSGSSKLRPQKVRGLEGHKIVQASAGGTHSVVLAASGRIFIWGRGSFGRLGLPADCRDCYSPVEVLLPGGYERWRVIAVAAGGRHSMCLAMPLRESAVPPADVDEEDHASDRGVGGSAAVAGDGSHGGDGDDEVDLASEPSLYDKDTMDERLVDVDSQSMPSFSGSGPAPPMGSPPDTSAPLHDATGALHTNTQWPILVDHGESDEVRRTSFVRAHSNSSSQAVAAAVVAAAASAAASAGLQPANSGGSAYGGSGGTTGRASFSSHGSAGADGGSGGPSPALGARDDEGRTGGSIAGGRSHRGSSEDGGGGSHFMHGIEGASDEEQAEDEIESSDEEGVGGSMLGQVPQGITIVEHKPSFPRPMSPRPMTPSSLSRVGSPLSMSPSMNRSAGASHKYNT